MIEVYHVSAQPEDWPEGRVFQVYHEAESEAHRIGGCVTAVRYTFDDSELVVDCSDGDGMYLLAEGWLPGVRTVKLNPLA